MVKRTAWGVGVSVVAGLLLASSGRASLYSPADPYAALPMKDDGKAAALAPDDFKKRIIEIMAAFDDRKKDGQVNKYRQRYLDLLSESGKIRNPSADEAVARAVYHLRLGQAKEAQGILIPLTRGRIPNYFALVALGNAFAAEGDWDQAINNHLVGLETEMPAVVPAWKPEQRAWYKRLDDDCILHFYKIRRKEGDARKGASQAELERLNETEDVLPLFPLPDQKLPGPVRFVNEEGKYQPGRLAAAEKAKLPPDALAIVQQLILWHPQETRLCWLLAELYAASGNLRGADMVFEMCAGSRQYANRKLMMEHRAAVRAALPQEAAPSETPLSTSEPDSPQPTGTTLSMQTIKYYFAAIGVVVLIAIARGKLRRRRQEMQ